MRQPIISGLSITFLAATPMLLATVVPTAESQASRMPEGYIPMFHDNSDEVSTMLNTNEITRITPMFDHEGILKRGDGVGGNYLEVQFSNGETIQVFEPFDEFIERIRKSQR